MSVMYELLVGFELVHVHFAKGKAEEKRDQCYISKGHKDIFSLCVM